MADDNRQLRVSYDKAVVPTPKGDDGSVAFDRVQSGDSIWITVGDPESPLHGRPVLITKRPDGLFAITGGMGPGVDERRHYVLTGTPKRSKRDRELEREVNEAKKYNEPLEAASRELRQEAREELRQASDDMLESLGLEDLNKDELLERKDEVQQYVADQLGEEATDEEAKRITDAVMRQRVAAERKVRERVQRERQVAVAKVGKRLQALKDRGEPEPETEDLLAEVDQMVPDRDAFSVVLPNVEELKELGNDEQVSAIANHFDRAADLYFDDAAPEQSDFEDEDHVFEVGQSVKPLELKDREGLNRAVEGVSTYWRKRAEAEETSKALKKVPLRSASPSTLASVRTAATATVGEMTPEEVEDRANQSYETWLRTNTSLAFYDAVADYWNDDTALSERLHDKDRSDSVMQHHVTSGAATALAALAQEHTGTKLDTMRLIESGNTELAATAVALEARRNASTPEEYDAIVEKVREHNRTNQAETESRALSRHAELDGQLKELRRQQESGELVDRVKGSSLELANLVEQRKNLGAALGSLQASATFFDRLEHFRTAKDDVVDINVGGRHEDAEAMVDRLGLKRNYTVDTSDPDNLRVRVGVGDLGKHVGRTADVTAKHDRYDALKTNMEGVEEDDQGNMVVPDYKVPGWKETYTDDEGNERPYTWRVEQRNDIEWLREATKPSEDNPSGSGGGLITRVTGAGKTNTTLGFYAHQLQQNPDYKGLVAVPKGRAQQWVDEANKFSDLNVELVPEGTSKDEVERMLLDSKPGTIYVTGHREAARAHETINAMQTHEDASLKFHGVTIDEPQELQARGQSGNIGAAGKRLMKVPFDHRVGLTATPARRLPTEAYDLIKWSSGAKDLGSKAGFKRTFGGFGGGTNAQDAAIAESYFKTIQPYVSGDRITHPTFKAEHERVDVRRSETQVQRQKEIEANSADHIETRRREMLQEARENPNHQLNRGPEATRSRRAGAQARREVEEMHAENMGGGEDWRENGKLSALAERMQSAPDSKHVMYVDTKAQRQALTNMLSDLGYGPREIKNIASTTTSITGKEMAQRVRDFKEGKVNAIMIDRASAAGYNLQQGDELHVLGTPQDAANYLQAQGRIARMPREGDIAIRTYRYQDAPEEASHWNDLDSQLKVLRASSPGLFSSL